ncbi:MAG: helix-hairpin-helix domain-containing protein [Lautropia sp.]
MWQTFLFGMVIGALAVWLALWWLGRQRRRAALVATMPLPRPAVASAAPAGSADAVASAGTVASTGGGVPAGALASTGGVASAGTSAGAVAAGVAVGAPGAVSTSSATLSSQAPVYRQVDLEAIAGLTPAVAAALRARGIETFAALAAAAETELAAAAGGPQHAVRWRAQARRAVAGDWAGFAAGNG